MSTPASLRREPVRVSAELLARYDRPGPRYSSYPAARDFDDAFSEADYRARLADADRRTDDPLSLYVHLPFCESSGGDCDCHVIVAREPDALSRYLDHLERELDLLATALPNRRSLSQLHWGGGTPAELNESLLERLFHMIARHFPLAPDAEASVEVDPSVTTDEQVTLLAGLGMNRVSMGVQDFTPEVQQAVNRVQSYEVTRLLFERCRLLGYRSIQIDLLYGLPHQSPEGFQRTLDLVIGMEPDRVAVFDFAHAPWAHPHQRKIDEATLPRPRARFELWARTLRSFTDAGYVQIGLDHFVLPDDDLAIAQAAGALRRNVTGYSGGLGFDQLGAGLGAIGEIDGTYVENVKWLSEYQRATERGELPVRRGRVLDADDQLRGYVIQQLLCNGALDVRDTEALFGVDFRRYFAAEQGPLAELAAAGFLIDSADWIEVTPLGRVFIRNVCMTFDRYLRRPRPGITTGAPRSG